MPPRCKITNTYCPAQPPPRPPRAPLHNAKICATSRSSPMSITARPHWWTSSCCKQRCSAIIRWVCECSARTEYACLYAGQGPAPTSSLSSHSTIDTCQSPACFVHAAFIFPTVQFLFPTVYKGMFERWAAGISESSLHIKQHVLCTHRGMQPVGYGCQPHWHVLQGMGSLQLKCHTFV